MAPLCVAVYAIKTQQVRMDRSDIEVQIVQNTCIFKATRRSQFAIFLEI